MNESQCRTDVRNLINTNKATLVSGITHQGAARVINQITRSTLTPVKSYYFILITVPRVREASTGPASRTVARPLTTAEYPVRIEVADEAKIQADDVEAYDQMELDFEKLCDRIIKLFKDQTSGFGTLGLTMKKSPSGEDDRQVEKINLSGTWKDTEGTSFASLYCQINLTLVDGCVDDSALYS